MFVEGALAQISVVSPVGTFDSSPAIYGWDLCDGYELKSCKDD